MIKTIIILCGYAHIALALGSIVIPKLLNWSKSLSAVPTLIRQMFWTYAGYILAINIFFGLISIIYVDELLLGSSLAKALLVLITLYWLARIVIQFTYFDKTGVPRTGIYLFGEIALNALFVLFTLSYGWAFFNTL